MQITMRRNPVARAFTLIELIAVIVVLAILSGIAIPKYFDYSDKAKASACKGTLGAVRSAIANHYMKEQLNTGTATYPTLQDLKTVGTVMQEPMPANPYNNSNEVQAGTWTAPTSQNPNPPQSVSGTHGWNYDATLGRFWANSSVAGENSW